MKSRKIDIYPNYIIFKDGKVYNEVTKNYLKGSINGAGYLFYRLKNSNGKYESIGCHRLLAICFIETTDDIKGLCVNHKNGNKLDNSLTNLEWATYKENLWHAGRNGLTTKCIPVTIIKPDGTNRLDFNSYIECAEYLGVSKDTVNYRAKSRGRRIFPDGYLYTNTSNVKSVLEYINSGKFINNNFGRSRVCLCMNILTNETITFDKVIDLANWLNIKFSTIIKHCNENKQKLINGKYVVKYDNGLPWRAFGDIEDELLYSTPGVPVCIVDEDAVVKKFHNAKQLSEYININESTLTGRLATNGSKNFDGLRYYYLNKYNAIMGHL